MADPFQKAQESILRNLYASLTKRLPEDAAGVAPEAVQAIRDLEKELNLPQTFSEGTSDNG